MRLCAYELMGLHSKIKRACQVLYYLLNSFFRFNYQFLLYLFKAMRIYVVLLVTAHPPYALVDKWMSTFTLQYTESSNCVLSK